MRRMKQFYFLFCLIISFGFYSSYAALTLPLENSLRITSSSISSDFYEFQFNPKNHLLLKNLYSKQSGDLLLKDGNIQIFLNLKHFFSLSFGLEDIEANILNSTPIYLAKDEYREKLRFFLKLFFLKLKLKMDTTTSFTKNRVLIPLEIDIPANGPLFLNSGSGLLYTFKIEKLSLLFKDHEKIYLKGQSDLIKKEGAKKLGENGLKFCPSTPDRDRDKSEIISNNCSFTFEAKNFSSKGEHLMRLKITLPSSIVEKGFYPLYVENVLQFKKDLNIPLTSGDEDPHLRAFYFEVSGLTQSHFINEYLFEL